MNHEIPERGGFFPSTHWTLIFQAQDLDRTLGRQALGNVLTAYREPLLGHLRWKFQASATEAEDWFHSFVEKKILEYGLLDRADEARGRFRTFLLKALDRFVWDELAKARAQKRAPDGGWLPLEAATEVAQPTPTDASPDPGDVDWARKVLQQAIERTHRWYEAEGNPSTWKAFAMGRIQPLLEGWVRPSDQEIGAACGLPPDKVANTITNAARKFRTELRAVVAEYAGDDASIEAEIQSLLAILRRAPPGQPPRPEARV